MNGFQQIKKQLLPLIKGLPFVVIMIILALLAAKMVIRYSSEKYQSIAKIKLDDQKIGFSSNEVYKDFSMFSLEHRMEAEVELLKSPIIIGQALDSLFLDLEITRIGSIKNTVLYDNCPFKITFSNPEKMSGSNFDLDIKKDSSYTVSQEGYSVSGRVGQKIPWMNDSLLIQTVKNSEDSNKYDLNGKYSVKMFSEPDMVARIASKLDVKAPDKETPILRVTYVDNNPKRAADIINAVCEAYINDFVVTKSTAASGTVDFIDGELDEISKKLASSERKLEVFKTNERVVNTKQETETGLREISQLRVDMINLEINERAMRDLERYMDQGTYFSETAINFGFGDLVLTELVKKLKFLNDERIDQLQKYTADSPQVKGVDKKIAEVKIYIQEAVKRNLVDIGIRKEGIQKSYEIQSHMFDELPTREKEQHILERDFMINESVYNFLSKKRIEAAILANSMISFHRIIHPATASKVPMSPNRTLIKFIAGLLGLLGGIGIIYLRRLIAAKVISREDVEKNSGLPFAGIIRKNASEVDFELLFRSMQMKNNLTSSSVIGICSANDLEGKKYVGKNLVKTIRKFGFSCAQVSFGTETTSNEATANYSIAKSASREIDERVEEIAKAHDYTIFIGPSSTKDVLAVKVLSLSDVGLFLLRSNYTGISSIQEADNLVDEYKLENVELVLNGAHKATNYRGSYVESRFVSTTTKSKSIIQRLKNFYKVYMK